MIEIVVLFDINSTNVDELISTLVHTNFNFGPLKSSHIFPLSRMLLDSFMIRVIVSDISLNIANVTSL